MHRTSVLLLLLIATAVPVRVSAQVAKPSAQDLERLEQRMIAVGEKAKACTVALRLPSEDGGVASGVIVSADGLVLTAGHCVPDPGTPIEIILDDGRKLEGEPLGRNGLTDAGLVRIKTPGKWPFVEMGSSIALRPRQLCLGAGHPGGRDPSRTAPLRLGIIRDVPTQWRRFLRTSCLIAPGDSGGPLFDLEGRVIGIHSYISPDLRSNYQVPIDTFREDWKRLLAGEQWNLDYDEPDFNGRPARPVMGISLDQDADACLVASVRDGYPAAGAGMKGGDVILRIDTDAVANRRVLRRVMRRKEPGDRIVVKVRRGLRELDLSFVLARGR